MTTAAPIVRMGGLNRLMLFFLAGWKVQSWYRKPVIYNPHRIMVILEYTFDSSKGYASWEI